MIRIIFLPLICLLLSAQSVFAEGNQSNATSGAGQYSNGGTARNAADQKMNDTLRAAAEAQNIKPDADGTYSAEKVKQIQAACGVEADGKWGNSSASADCPQASSGPAKVIVTEKIPGLDCESIGGETPTTRKYRCEIKSTFGTVMDLLKGLIKYAAFLAILVSVLLLVISGIKMSIEGKKEDSKKMFSRVIVSLIVLFSMGLILNTIAPWVYN